MSKGRKKGSGALGRSLIKDRNRTNRSKSSGDGWLHTSDLEDGYDWGRLNLRSVTEESRLDEFLNTAELAGIEFKAEKLNIKIVGGATYTGLPSEQEKKESRKAQEEYIQYLSIPRRPMWNNTTSAEELEEKERESFLDWRRSLVHLQEDERLILTPFERNLDFWRQLWRVVERSDILVQIVDARNPLLFRCEDLEKYVLEVSPKKVNMILISKADLLTPRQRQGWANYFQRNSSIVVAFWSATLETERINASKTDSSSSPHSDSKAMDIAGGESSPGGTRMLNDGDSMLMEDDAETPFIPMSISVPVEHTETTPITPPMTSDLITTPSTPGPTEAPPTTGPRTPNPTAEAPPTRGSDLLTREELIDLFYDISPVSPGSITTVGMVGYPNVGKSSTINALFQGKKVPVSATPGRTKHFQTLFLSEDLLLCDCPGLVFPTFLSSKAEMVCCGILPVDQLRDHTPPVSLVCQRVPRQVLERTYRIRIPPPGEGEDPTRPPYAHELLASYGYMRGFMTSHGQPDEPRSARYVLKDYVNGKLLFCQAPPGEDEWEFNHQLWSDLPTTGPPEGLGEGQEPLLPPHRDTARKPHTLGKFDAEYFRQEHVRAVTKGVSAGVSAVGSQATQQPQQPTDKPWKKHHNRHKKEKIRRTFPNSY